MRISKDARKLSRELFRQTFVEGQLDEARARQIVRAVIERKPRGYAEILKNYARLLKLEAARRHAVIESAVPLSSADATAIAGDLRERHGRDITTEFSVNPELLGGLRIQLGSDVWDGTVRNRLQRLQENFTHV